MKVIYQIVSHGGGLSTVESNRKKANLTVGFSGGAHWLSNGVDFKAYLSQSSVRQNISTVKDESWFAHHILLGKKYLFMYRWVSEYFREDDGKSKLISVKIKESRKSWELT